MSATGFDTRGVSRKSYTTGITLMDEAAGAKSYTRGVTPMDEAAEGESYTRGVTLMSESAGAKSYASGVTPMSESAGAKSHASGVTLPSLPTDTTGITPTHPFPSSVRVSRGLNSRRGARSVFSFPFSERFISGGVV